MALLEIIGSPTEEELLAAAAQYPKGDEIYFNVTSKGSDRQLCIAGRPKTLKRDEAQPQIFRFKFVVPSAGYCRLIGEVNINTRRGSLDPEQPTNPALAWLALDRQTEVLLENRGLLTLEALKGLTENKICTKLLVNPLRFGGPPLQSAQAAVERFVGLRARLEALGFNQSFAGPRLSEQELLDACFPKEIL